MRVRDLTLITAAALFAVIGVLSGCTAGTTTEVTSAAQPPAGMAKTLENLQAAYNGESNANAKYLAFAKKADDEGYAKVASLFRAAARAEAIHISNHAQVIKQLGAAPKADIKTAEVKSTAENLKAAIEGESYERDTMYPEFLAEARQSGSKEAVRTFNLAKLAEAEHAKLYTEALANLDQWKSGPGTFYVCSTCGYTTANGNLEKCPVDFTSREKFEVIN
jgi:rubrerythrin